MFIYLDSLRGFQQSKLPTYIPKFEYIMQPFYIIKHWLTFFALLKIKQKARKNK